MYIVFILFYYIKFFIKILHFILNIIFIPVFIIFSTHIRLIYGYKILIFLKYTDIYKAFFFFFFFLLKINIMYKKF